jgi:hypothetical protein
MSDLDELFEILDNISDPAVVETQHSLDKPAVVSFPIRPGTLRLRVQSPINPDVTAEIQLSPTPKYETSKRVVFTANVAGKVFKQRQALVKIENVVGGRAEAFFAGDLGTIRATDAVFQD